MAEQMGRLPNGWADVPADQIAVLLQEARAEAMAAAKAIIKERLVQAILERALGEPASSGELISPADAAPVPTTAPASAPADEEQLRREIAAIRSQIAANERALQPFQAAPPPAEDVPPVSPAPGAVGYYVYGIVRRDGDQPLAGLPAEGLDPAYPVYGVPGQAVLALVSQVSLPEFGPAELQARLEDLQWLDTKVRLHQGILEAVLAGRPLIPLRFCTIYQSEDRIREMLTQHQAEFVALLDRLAGRQEWGVKVYCDAQTLAQHVSEVSDRVQQLQAEIAQQASGAAYFLKKKLAAAVAEEVERVGDEVAQRAHDCLSRQAVESVVNPRQSQELSGRQEAMLLNGAYLVAAEHLPAFRAEWARLQEESHGRGFSFEMTGPWPPYNFVA
ncbi:MAG: GvpL/GvpF family gas vesicle protein, partial [Chloroflexi bacterium]|nr:GvpL/GvpF family gas vesicle protein [Chloroflexota bacterium]